jgi:hypothetical protein
VLSQGVDPRNTFYVLNPHNNLSSTEQQFRANFSRSGGEGIKGSRKGRDNVPFLQNQLLQPTFCLLFLCPLCHMIPSMHLPTSSYSCPFLCSEAGWRGVVGEVPSPKQVQAALTEHDLYM